MCTLSKQRLSLTLVGVITADDFLFALFGPNGDCIGEGVKAGEKYSGGGGGEAVFGEYQ